MKSSGTNFAGGRLAIAAVGLLLAALPLAGQQSTWRQEGNRLVREVKGSIATPTPLVIQVRSELGNVTLRQSTGNELGYDIVMKIGDSARARQELAQWPVSVRREGNELLVSAARGPSPSGRDLVLEVTVDVPANAARVNVHSAAGNIGAGNLTVAEHLETAGGNISVGRPRADTWAETAGGNVSVGGIVGALHVSTAGGNVSIGDIAGSGHLETEGGNITVGDVRGPLSLASGGGSIHVEGVRGDLNAMTGGGNIDLGTVTGAVRAQTGGGNVDVARAGSLESRTGGGNIRAGAVDGPVRVETGAGGIDVGIVATAGHFGDSQLRSGAGKVTVRLPGNLPLTVSADLLAPMGHAIISDFPALNATGRSGAPLRVQAALNGGGPHLAIQTTAGDIVIRRQTAAAMRSAVDWRMRGVKEDSTQAGSR